jgi:type II secretory pathway component GspD/PulD (secretin)
MGYRTALPMFMGLALLGTGCVQTTTTQSDGAVLPVVSADPARDSSALTESNRQLTDVKWQVIEHKGPKTAAEQFGLDKPKDSAQANGHHGVSNHSATGPTVQGHVRVSYPTPNPQATSQPTSRPATQPTTETVELPVFSPEGLPVEIVPLMDGRVRIIWTLRNYGGTAVTSNRDPVTSRRTVAIAPPDLAPLVTVLQQQIGAGGNVTPLPRENTLIVTCDRVMESPVLDLLSKLDVAPRQVEIAARIFEVSRDFNLEQGSRVLLKHVGHDNSQTGISLFDANKGVNVPVAAAAAAAAQATPGVGSVISLVKVFESAGISLDASFQILADEGLIRMVSNPRMTVAAGQTGYLLAGQELPIQTANYINNVYQSSTTYKPVGVQLYITPQAVGPNRIKLHTITIVSSVSGFTPVPTLTGQNAREFLMNPVIDSREAETAVTIENGSTLVISGLRMTRTTTREEKVPGLGDLPLLGWMFKNHRSQQQLTDLYFFVTPTLLDADSAAPPEAQSTAPAPAQAKHRES